MKAKRFIQVSIVCVLLSHTYFSYALTKVKKFHLENGIKVILMELHSLPIVKVNLGLRGGSIWENPKKAGIGAIAMDLLDQGTESKSALQIAKSLDFVGASISASAGKDFSTVNLSVLSKDLDLGLGILSDIVLHPSFPQKEVERVKKETVSAIEKKEEDPSNIARDRFGEIVYGSSHYGRPLEGYSKTVKGITREDIKNYYKKAVRPALTTLVVVGDVTEQVIREKLSGLFGKWANTDAQLPKFSAVHDYNLQNASIEKDLTQTTIFLGHPGIKRGNPDYYATYVMNYIMGGGGFSSRMMHNIRDNNGLVYTVYSYFSAKYYDGAFYVFAQTKNKTKGKALKLIKEEMERIIKNPVTKSELEDAKSYIIGSFPLKLDTTEKVASYLTYIEQYHLGLDYFETFPKRIEKVTMEDIEMVAQKYLHPENVSTVLVGGKS